MPQVLNNEVDILNVANIDNDIRDSYTRAMIAGEEKETYCTRQGGYDINEFFIWTDRQIYKTKTPVDQGDTFVLNTNIEFAGTLSDQMYQLFSQSPEAIREVLSNIENGSTASRNFRKGEYILWTDGFLYEVSANTNLGTAWTVGTNITKKNNITDELTSLNEALTNEIDLRNKLGAKNLLPLNIRTQVSNGVTFTVNPDGSISLSGTATGNIWVSVSDVSLAQGRYILSGCPNGGSENSYFMYTSINDVTYADIGNGISFDIIDETISVTIKIISGTNTNGLTFYPMIRLASDTDSTYQLYAMTNRELTENVGQYVLVEEKTFRVTKDGVKTYAQLLTEAMALANTYVRNNGYYIGLVDIIFASRMCPDIQEIMPGIYGTNFLGSLVSHSEVTLYCGVCATNTSGFNPYYRRIKISNSGGITYTDLTNTVATEDAVVVGNIYKKMK